MLVERHNEAAAIAALSDPMISTRICVSVQPETEVFRFVKDTGDILVERPGDDDWLFHKVPYAEFAPINSGDGRSADTTTITMDGADIIATDGHTVDSVLQSILEFPLRDRPIQIGLLVLNIETQEPIGIIPQFIGFIDNVPFSREKTDKDANVKLEINCASFRAYAQRQFARTYSDTDHQARFPGDRACRWISDAVFRGGKYSWNSESARGSGSGGGYPGYTPGFGPGFNNFNLR